MAQEPRFWEQDPVVQPSAQPTGRQPRVIVPAQPRPQTPGQAVGQDLQNRQTQGQIQREGVPQSYAPTPGGMAPIAGGPGQTDRVDAIRREFMSDPTTRNFSTLLGASRQLEQLGRTDNAQSDMAIIFGFMRALDPNSVVREAEFANAQNAAGVPDIVRNYYNRLMSGERLTSTQRQNMIHIARELVEAGAPAYNERAVRYQQILAQTGIPDPETHIPSVPARVNMGEIIEEMRQTGEIFTPPGGRVNARGEGVNNQGELGVLDIGANAPDAPVEGLRLTPEQYNELIQFAQSRPTAQQLDQWFRDHGFGGLNNAEAVAQGLQRGQMPTAVNYNRVDEAARLRLPENAQTMLDAAGTIISLANPITAASAAPTLVMGGLDAAGAQSRGRMDVQSFGFMDEIAGVASELFGGDYGQTVNAMRAVAADDEERNFVARLQGQIEGGVAMPFPAGPAREAEIAARIAARLRQAGAGAGYGGGYGFGSGDGSFNERAGNAAVGAGIGAAIPFAIEGVSNVAGRVVGSRVTEEAARRGAVGEAAERLNVDVRPATTGGVGTRFVSGVTEGGTLGGIQMNAAAQREMRQLGEAAQDVASRVGGGNVGDDVAAGAAAQRGVRSWLETTEQQANRLYDDIPIEGSAAASVDETRTALTELTRGMSSNPELGQEFVNPTLVRYRNALQNGGLSWEDMKAFRTWIGQRIGRPPVAGENVTDQQYRALYAALSRDMEATARGQGTQAFRSFQRANNYWRGREGRRETVMTALLGREGNATSQETFRTLNSWAQANSGNWANLRRALGSMDETEANAVRATILSRMGMATRSAQDETGEVFSASTFMTNWNGLHRRARSVLFPSGEHRQAITDLVNLSAGVKRGQQFTNWSRSGMAASGGGQIVAASMYFLSNPLPFIAGAIGQAAMGALMSSPRFAQFLARRARSGNPGGLLDDLSRFAARNPAVSQEVTGLRDALQRAANDNVALPAAASGGEGEQGQ